MAPPDTARRLLLFTKPAVPGRVKTRLTTRLSPEEAARCHRAFLEDLVERLAPGPFDLHLAWALEPGEEPPVLEGPDGRPLPQLVQRGRDLGERLYRALGSAAREAPAVAALGSDHPTVALDTVADAFRRIEAGAEVVLGPSEDGGYYLIALAAHAVRPELFHGVPWSTERVLAATLDRVGRAGLRLERLPVGRDIDTPLDLDRLTRQLATGEVPPELVPRTARLLAELAAGPASMPTHEEVPS